MRISCRVRFSDKASKIMQRKHPSGGIVHDIRGDYAIVVWDGGKRKVEWHRSFLKEEDPFPYRSHRTMAEVMRDEAKGSLD